jgi:hypothetical protein
VAKDQGGNLIDRLRRAVLAGSEADLTDGQLLECFVSRRDVAGPEARRRRPRSVTRPAVWASDN